VPEILVEIGNATFSKDDKFFAATLRLKAASIIRVINAAKIEFECETLIIDGPVIIDTHGDNGRDGVHGHDCPLPVWTSGLHHDDFPRRHREYVQAIQGVTPPNELGGNATPGTNGGDGGHFLIRYRQLGEGSQPGNVTKRVEGGKSGRPAHGGQGRLLHCGWPSREHDREYTRRAPGKDWSGRDGAEGSVELVRF
jgi:hypothetical protein